MPRSRYTGPPMTLGNIQANGVRSLMVHYWVCGHDVVLNSERWSDEPAGGCRFGLPGLRRALDHFEHAVVEPHGTKRHVFDHAAHLDAVAFVPVNEAVHRILV